MCRNNFRNIFPISPPCNNFCTFALHLCFLFIILCYIHSAKGISFTKYYKSLIILLVACYLWQECISKPPFRIMFYTFCRLKKKTTCGKAKTHVFYANWTRYFRKLLVVKSAYSFVFPLRSSEKMEFHMYLLPSWSCMSFSDSFNLDFGIFKMKI